MVGVVFNCSTNIVKGIHIHKKNLIFFIKAGWSIRSNYLTDSSPCIPHAWGILASLKYKENMKQKNRILKIFSVP